MRSVDCLHDLLLKVVPAVYGTEEACMISSAWVLIRVRQVQFTVYEGRSAIYRCE